MVALPDPGEGSYLRDAGEGGSIPDPGEVSSIPDSGNCDWEPEQDRQLKANCFTTKHLNLCTKVLHYFLKIKIVTGTFTLKSLLVFYWLQVTTTYRKFSEGNY